MYTQRIETYIKVVECGSFAKAAECLYLTSVSVMKQINQLEAEIGVKLLKRTNRGIELTEAGKSLYHDAKRIVQEADEAINHTREIGQIRPKTIRIGTSILNPCTPLMNIWNRIRNKYPQIKVKIIPIDDNHETILENIAGLGTSIDFMAAICGSTQWLNRCKFYELYQCTKSCAVSHTHRLAEKKILTIEDLYGETLLVTKYGDSLVNMKLRDYLSNNHPQIRIKDAPFFYDLDVFNECEEKGYVLLTYEMWATVHPGLVTIPVKWDFSVPYGIMSALKPTKIATLFLDAILEELNKESDRPILK